MKLFVDMGNSRLKWIMTSEAGGGVSKAVDLSQIEDLYQAWENLDTPRKVYIANVSDALYMDKVCQFIKAKWNCDPISIKILDEFLGLKMSYKDISQLGVDRWLSMLYASQNVAGPFCVVSCGTALTIDGVDSKGRHAGGYIIPGRDLMRRTLFDNTANIRFHDTVDINPGPGNSTSDCVSNGTGLAVIASIARAVQEVESRIGSHSILYLTGGGASEINEHLDRSFRLEENMVLKGMMLYAEHY